jgi:hypothetical protein
MVGKEKDRIYTLITDGKGLKSASITPLKKKKQKMNFSFTSLISEGDVLYFV